MSDEAVIHQVLRRAAVRRRLDRALRGMWLGLLGGCAVWLLAVLVFKVAPLPDAWVPWAGLGALGAGIAGFVAGGWRRVPLATAARVVEARQSLDQRLSTALEVGGRPGDPSWARLVVADAAKAIRGVEVARLLPFGLPRFVRWIPLFLAALIGLGFLPEYRSAGHLKRKKDAEIVRETGRRVAEVVRREVERRDPLAEPVKEALEAAAEAGARLSQAKLTKADALDQLKSASERLQEEARQLEQDPVLKRLRQAAKTPSSSSTAANAASQKRMDQLRQSTAGASPDELQKLAEQLRDVQKAAADMQAGQPDASAQQALAQSLNQLAQSAKNLGLNLAGLDKALDALKNLPADRLLADLKQAGNDLDKLRDMAKKLAEMQQEMAKVGKDLAEQLDRGQTDAAAATLEKMAKEMAEAGLTPDQLKRIMEEVAKALPAAGTYGKVAELLKAAGDRMQAGAKPDASKNLAAAAAELRKLAEQSQDLEMLADALEALEGAQLAIASGRAWQPGGT